MNLLKFLIAESKDIKSGEEALIFIGRMRQEIVHDIRSNPLKYEVDPSMPDGQAKFRDEVSCDEVTLKNIGPQLPADPRTQSCHFCGGTDLYGDELAYRAHAKCQQWNGQVPDIDETYSCDQIDDMLDTLCSAIIVSSDPFRLSEAKAIVEGFRKQYLA